MTKSDFDAFVKRQAEQEEEEAAFDPAQKLEEWMESLAALYKQITGYLKTYTDDRKAHIDYRYISLNEEFIGVYTAPEMILKIGRATVTLTPVGTMLFGTQGRVDVQGPVGTARLALVNKEVTTARQLVRVTATRAGDPPIARPSRKAVKQIERVWKISTPPPDISFIELTQETFFDMVLAVANA